MPDRSVLVTTLIRNRPMCTPCIVAKSGLTQAALEAALINIGKTLVVRDVAGPCLECGESRRVLSLDRPGA